MNTPRGPRAWLPIITVLVVAMPSCGGTGDGGFGNGSPQGPAGAGASGGSPSLGVGATGTGASQSCTAGATQSCCTTGTQTCPAGGELPTWGPCLDQTGAVLTCSGPGVGGGGNEDGGGAGVGGGGSEDGGGAGLGGGGAEDAVAPPLPPTPALCSDGNVNTEPEILVGYFPANGQAVGATGQIKVWVNDEGAPIISPGEQIDPTTGKVTTPGDRMAKAPDGYLWEPALYIAPQTAENGGTPHFPSYIRGDYNNAPGTKNGGTNVPGMDPVPPGAVLTETYTAEDVWDVSSLGLAPGEYIAEFVIHDGDDDRAVGCVTIVVGPK